MKPSLTFLIAAATAFGAAFALAQDDRQPPIPDSIAAATPAPATPPAPPDTPAPPPPAARAPTPSVTPPTAPDQQPPDRRPGRRGPADTGFIDGGRSQREKRPGDGPQNPGAQRPGEDRHESPFGAWRNRDGGNRDGGPGHEQRPPMPPPKPTPFIGVVTAPVPPPLAAQLGLQEDFGLIVDAVLPNSPAATAGLQRFDVLKLYNDQQIVDVRQLAILVRATGKDGSASLTIIRKAQEQKISITVGEHAMPNRLGGAHPPGDSEHPHGSSFMHPGFEHHQFADHDSERHHAEQPGGNRENENRHQSRRPRFDRERFAQDRSERHQRFDRAGADRRGEDGRERHEHRGYHMRFAHQRFERGGREDGRSCHGGCAHERFGRDHWHRHHHHHHRDFARRDGHHGSGHEGFNREGSRDRAWEHDRLNRSQPSDRAGRPHEGGGPNPENRNRDFPKRMDEGQHHSSNDNDQQPSELPPLQPANLLREIRPGGAAEIRITQPAGTVVYDTANARVQFSDAAMKIEIATKEGHRTLRATDPEGGTLFEGALETDEQMKNVPEDIRKKLDWIEARSPTEVVAAPPQEIPAEAEAANVSQDDTAVL